MQANLRYPPIGGNHFFVSGENPVDLVSVVRFAWIPPFALNGSQHDLKPPQASSLAALGQVSINVVLRTRT
jgi:hypothetical protein